MSKELEMAKLACRALDDKKGKDPVKIQAFIEAVKEADEKSS